MRLWLIVVLALACLAGCSSPVSMRNPMTGETVKCGPYVGVAREMQCINDYKDQGFVRVPG